MIGGRVLDTSALEHFATGRSIYARALVWATVEQSNVLMVPTTALTVARSRIPAETHPVLEVLLGLPNTVVEILDPPAPTKSGSSSPPLAARVTWLRPMSSGVGGGAAERSSPPIQCPCVNSNPNVEIEELP